MQLAVCCPVVCETVGKCVKWRSALGCTVDDCPATQEFRECDVNSFKYRSCDNLTVWDDCLKVDVSVRGDKSESCPSLNSAFPPSVASAAPLHQLVMMDPKRPLVVKTSVAARSIIAKESHNTWRSWCGGISAKELRE